MTTNTIFNKFNHSYNELVAASNLTRAQKIPRLMSVIDRVCLEDDGIGFLYEHISKLEQAGIFDGSPWQNADKLVPVLVRGTLKSGHPNSTIEVLSELRMLHRSRNGQKEAADAARYLEEVIVHNLDFGFGEATEEMRTEVSSTELTKIFNLFRFLMETADLDGIKDRLADELTLITEQRPVVVKKAQDLIALIKDKVSLTGESQADAILQSFVDALYAPTDGAKAHPSMENYAGFLAECSASGLMAEARQMGVIMRKTGLVSPYHAVLVRAILDAELDDLVTLALRLNSAGTAELNQRFAQVSVLIRELVHPTSRQFLYGLARMLEKGMFSREAVRAGLGNLKRIKMNPLVEQSILNSIDHPHPDLTALHYLQSALIRILGQPLGVGQGNNPTCQSARGISLWSQYAPAKLINLVITAATKDNLAFRFENNEIESGALPKGLVDKLDHNLDAVSIVLVPKLDKIYNEMMKRASARGEDPHKWVNPALYGHWIPLGFASSYNYLLNAIQDFRGFVKLFYAAFHPEFNNGRELVYPIPLGILITSNKGDMVGFHAVSLMRIKPDPDGVMRAYFNNPNNEGRQDWGQDIKPTVFGHGEMRGESSLPFEQLASRVYAFHFHQLDVEDRWKEIPNTVVDPVVRLGKESWGRSYQWIETERQW